MKKCNKCGEEKPLSEFEKKRRGKDWRRGICRVCRRDQRKGREHIQKQDPLLYQAIVKAKEQERESIRTRTSKKCNKCGIVKQLDLFPKAKEKKDGRGGICKKCRGASKYRRHLIRMQEPEYRAKHKMENQKRYIRHKQDPIYIAKQQNPEHRAKCRAYQRKLLQDPEYREKKNTKTRERQRKQMQDPAYRAKHNTQCRERKRERRRKYKETPEYQLEIKAREDRKQERLRFLMQDPRRCNYCGEEKPLTEFDLRRNKGNRICRECIKTQQRELKRKERNAPGGRERRNAMDRKRRMLHPPTPEQRVKAKEYIDKRMQDPVYRANVLVSKRNYAHKRAQDPVLRAQDVAMKKVNRAIRMQDPVYRKKKQDMSRESNLKRRREDTFLKILMLGAIVRDD